MVTVTQICVLINVCVIAVAAGIVVYSTYGPVPEFPGAEISEVEIPDMPARTDISNISLPSLHIRVSFHDVKLYERAEFKVEVTDHLSQPVEGAIVSFMKPTIHHITNDEGVVYFTPPYISKASAPHFIREEYISSPDDTSCTFPLIVYKDGLNATKLVTVHIRP